MPPARVRRDPSVRCGRCGGQGQEEESALVATDKGDAVAHLEVWGGWRTEDWDDTPRVNLVIVRSYVSAGHHLVLNVTHEIWATIFAAKNF